MNLSIVIPLLNEEESLPELTEWIRRVCKSSGYSYEIIFIDDGSRDKSWHWIATEASANNDVRGIRFARNYGKSAALNVGFERACGEVVITMDADLQDSPDEIPDLYKMIAEDGYDLVSGWKKKRYDPLTKTIPTKLFNWATRKMSGIYLHDFNCGLKAYKNEVIKSIEVYGEMHRYIPVIAKRAGYFNITEKVVQHRERKYGATKFGIERFINGFLDLLTISFVTRFSKKPMHFFGLIGTLMFAIGFLGAFYLGIEKWYQLSQGIKARLITDQPVFFILLTCMILGTQLFLAGFISELVARSSSDRNKYLIKQELN